MTGSLLAACFNRLTCVRCPFGNRLVLLFVFWSTMVSNPYSVFEWIKPRLPPGKQRVEWDTGPIKPNGINRCPKMVSALPVVVGERTDPSFESGAKRFLIAELGSNLPKRDSFSTITRHGLRSSAVTIRGSFDGRVMGDCFFAIWAYNLVFHFLSFRCFRLILRFMDG